VLEGRVGRGYLRSGCRGGGGRFCLGDPLRLTFPLRDFLRVQVLNHDRARELIVQTALARPERDYQGRG
jgi:hypothetical protein